MTPNYQQNKKKVWPLRLWKEFFSNFHSMGNTVPPASDDNDGRDGNECMGYFVFFMWKTRLTLLCPSTSISYWCE
jgi:hypothetical protein